MNDRSGIFKRIINFSIANEKDTFSLEQITSDTFLFSAAIVSVLSCIINFCEGFPLVVNLFTVFSSLVLMFLYYLSRFRKYYNIWLSSTTVLVLLSLSWFMNGGGVGSVSFMYLCTLMILNFIASSNQQNKLFIIVLLDVIVLYIADYFWGDVLVHHYPDTRTQYFDIAFVFMLILFCVFFSTRYIKRAYEKERNLVREKTKELEISNEKRTNVFINLAHETKTPLTLITNYLEDYMRKNGKQEDEELNLLKKSIDSLTKDVINFFDMEKIQKGVSIYNHNSLADFSQTLINCIRLFAVIAAKKQIEIVQEISEKIYVKSDPNALLRIINNLIENAIKYTPDGGRIEIRLKKEDKKAILSVKDNGIGIPFSLQEKIFEPYYQINSQKANFQGIGLGLSIVKRTIVELGGTIEIESNPDKGTGTQMNVSLLTFEEGEEFHLKDADIEPFYYDVPTINIPAQMFDEEKFSILIVEDDIALLNYIAGYLQKNYNIIYALNGEEAVEKLKKITQVDLIISDLMMDNGDGFFLYNYVLTTKKLSHVPLIFLTANHSNDSRMQGLTMGAIDYISKPVYIDELNKKVNSVLNSFVNQRNAILTHAYNSILITKKNRELPIENPVSGFESNCVKYTLTAREIEVIRLLAEGKITKEIAGKLHISVDTVKKHIQNSYDKVDVGNKFDLLKKLMS
ncbi:MAG TPA: ATP-binding protein [Bacteroidia bacterium]|nr:ATP-binding protein [Bacteroidia bacterium]